jgi:hypothetical protein
VGWLIEDLDSVLRGQPQSYPILKGMLPALDL